VARVDAPSLQNHSSRSMPIENTLVLRWPSTDKSILVAAVLRKPAVDCSKDEPRTDLAWHQGYDEVDIHEEGEEGRSLDSSHLLCIALLHPNARRRFSRWSTYMDSSSSIRFYSPLTFHIASRFR